MATYDFTLNRDEVISGALRILGVISQGQTPDTDQVNDAAEALNILVKAWQSEGLPLWALKEVSFTPVAATSTYACGTGLTVNTQEPLKVHQMWYRNTTSNVDVPMLQLMQQQYNAMTVKSQEGTPTQWYYERLNGSGNIHLYLTPDATFCANNNIHFLMQRPFADFDASTDVPDFPQEWIRALKYGLADEMSLEYGYPAKERQELMLRASQYKEDALSFSEEDGSLFFQPDTLRWK